jgi:hypothetical protein
LANDSATRERLRDVLRPLEQQGIDAFQIRQNRRVVESISKSELPYFSPRAEQEILRDEERPAFLEIVSLSFKDNYKWRFSDGNATFTADVNDEAFFTAVQSRKVIFGRGDVVEVKLRTITWRTPNGLKTEHSISQVLNIIHAAEQLPLDFEF